MKEKAIELLKENYQSALEEEDDWLFFSCLCDYVALIIKLPETHQLVKKAMTEREIFYVSMGKSDKDISSKLIEILKEIEVIIKKNKIRDDSIEAYRDKIKALLEDQIATTELNSVFIYGEIHSILDHLNIIGHGGLVEHLKKKNEFGLREPNFTYLLREGEKINEKIEEKKEYSVWGAFEKLLQAKMVILERSEQKNKLDVRKLGYWRKSHNLAILFKDVELLRNPKGTERPTFFKKKEYRLYLKRAHSYLRRELAVMSEETKKDQTEKRSKGNTSSSLVIEIGDTKVTHQEDKITLEINGKEAEVYGVYPTDAKKTAKVLTILKEKPEINSHEKLFKEYFENHVSRKVKTKKRNFEKRGKELEGKARGALKKCNSNVSIENLNLKVFKNAPRN
jgi:hypothetical protein